MLSLERSLNEEEWVTGELRHVTEPQVQSPQFCFTTKAPGLFSEDTPSLGHLVPRALGCLGNALGGTCQ